MKAFSVISDGACSRNPGPGGWGLIVVTPKGWVKEWGGAEGETTNNRMELFGYYRGLQEVYRALKGEDPGETNSSVRIRVVSDSKYVLEGAERSLVLWQDRHWKTVAGEPVKNRDLWEKINQGQTLLREAGCRFEYHLVKGHSGSEANERVDQIAVRFSRGENVDLYEGPEEGYGISLELGAVFKPVYLSLVEGKVERHSTWEECQRATAGRPGVRFKKVKNRLEEKEILASWGVLEG